MITGELRHGFFEEPVAGGSVYAVNRVSREVVASDFSGTTQVLYNPANGGISLRLFDTPLHIPDGKYVIPVPKGIYNVGVEAVDGQPAAAGNIGLVAQIGSIFGRQNFVEEFFNGSNESAVEARYDQTSLVSGNLGITTPGVDITTNLLTRSNNFGNPIGFGFIDVPPGFLYAVQIPASQIEAINPDGRILIQGALVNTTVVDASVPAVFARAVLTTGVVNPGNTVTIHLATPLKEATGFLGADNDFAPFYFNNPNVVGNVVRTRIRNGTLENLFIVLQIPTTTPFPGVSGQPPLGRLAGAIPSPPPGVPPFL